MTHTPGAESAARLQVARWIAYTFAAYAFVASLISFIGWPANIPSLADWDGNGIAMQPNAAVAGVLVGASLVLLVAGHRRSTRLLAALLVAIGGLTLLEHATGVNLGIDGLLLFGREWGERGTLAPGRMGIPGSLSWTLLGVGILLGTGGEAAKRSAPWPAFGVILIASLSIIGHLLGVNLLFALPRLTAVALQTSTITLAGSLGLIAALPGQHPMRRLLEDSAAGVFVRRTLPTIIVLPLLLAWLRMEGERRELFDSPTGLALITLLLSTLLAVVMWRGAIAVARHERRLASAYEASARAEMVLRTSRDQVTLLDREWRYVYVNDHVLEVPGIPREDWIGKSIWEVWPTIVGTELEAAARRVMERRVPEAFEYCYAAWDRWFDIRLHPTPDGGVALLALEVTARRQAEDALRRRERDLQLITDAVPALVSYIDRDERYRFMNREYESWFGTPREQMLGKTMDEVLGTAAMTRLRPYVDQALRGESVRFEMETPYRHGGTRWIDCHYTPDRDANGQVAGFFVLVLDVTQTKRAQIALRDNEARLSAILDRLPVGVGVVDRTGRVLLSNGTMREYAPALIPSRDPERIDRWRARRPDGTPLPPHEWPRERALRGEDASEGVEFTYRGDDGTERWLLVSAVPFRDSSGTLVGAISVLQDITARKRDETALRQSEEALREADRRKDEFLATLAHELRNPMAPLMNSLEILKLASDKPDVAQRARTTMERQVTHMVRLIDDLLDVSRITRGTLELRRQRVPLAPIIQHAAEACRPLVDAGRHALRVELPSEPLFLHADQVRLTQVFGNLLTNACRYTEPGGLIELRAWREGSDLLVSVRDNGVGIPPEMLAQIFEMFTQLDRPLERSHGGLGVGLTLVKRLVEMHGGSVTAHSEGVGLGSEFLVRLPLIQEATVAAPTLGTPTAMIPLPVRRVLVADDSRDTADTLAALLGLGGCEVEVALDGVQAVEKAARYRPDAILLDIGLPRLNGYDACRAIRAEPWGRHVTIVAVTGWGQEEDRRLSADAGFDGHLVKPVEYPTLARVLSESARGAPAA